MSAIQDKTFAIYMYAIFCMIYMRYNSTSNTYDIFCISRMCLSMARLKRNRNVFSIKDKIADGLRIDQSR